MNHRWTWIRRSINPIVIDFGHHTLRMLQLSNDGRKVQVIARASRRMPDDLPSGNEISSVRARLVQDMLREGTFHGRDVVSVVPWDIMAIRNIRVPCMPEDELTQVVRYEACERFGFEPSGAEIRYLSAGQVRQGTDMRHEVIALGAGGGELDAHLQMLDQLGLTTVGLDPGPCALFRSFERFLKRDEDRQKVCAIVDLGHAATRVLVSQGDHPVFFKSISCGGTALDSELGRALKVSAREANRLRCAAAEPLRTVEAVTPPDDVDGDRRPDAARLRANLEPAAIQLAREIGLCLRYCAVTFRGMQTPTVFLVGGGARDGVLRELLARHLAASVEVGRCMREIEMKVEHSSGGRDRRCGDPDWTTVVGAGLKKLADQEVLVS